MTDEEFTEYLNERFEDQRSWLSEKTAKYKRWHQVMLISSTVLAGAAPVVTALAGTKAVPVTLTAAVSIVSSLHGASRFKELWTRYRATAEALKRELYWYRAAIRDYSNQAPDERRRLFVERVESWLFMEHDLWVQDQNDRRPPPVRKSS